MGKRGPRKIPTKQLAARGSRWAKDRDGEPEVPGEKNVMPEPPKYLGTQAVKKWKELGPILTEMETLTVVDVDLFATYCETWVRWLATIEDIRQNGETHMIKSGRTLRPESNLSIKLAEQLGRMQAKLGMSAADRAGIKVPGGKKVKKSTRGRKKSKNILPMRPA